MMPQARHSALARRRPALPLVHAVILVLLAAPLTAQETSEHLAPPPEDDPASRYMKPTTLGLRLTPEIAGAMSRKIVENMSREYELSPDQAASIENIFQQRLMRFAHENEKTGQRMIEFMMATMIENDGRFPRDKAQEFAKMAKPMLPNLKQLVSDIGADVGKEMSMSQRLRFTGDMTKAAAGITIFETRMKRWEEGTVGENANPFWDPSEKDPSAVQTDSGEDPNEHPDLKRARLEVERWSLWEVNIDGEWPEYVKRAGEYYEFDEKQKTAAEAILKQCQERAGAIKSPEWTDRVKKNRIARRLTRRSRDEIREGPVAFALDQEYERLRRPLQELDAEFKRRIDELPDARQRAAAKDAARQMLSDRGMQEPPI
ncbi:MAG: hypothetical protein DCC65_10445 [Planctomycetota bacterium]|nr:MAG: hypothetical protein DCC65_10445 [Planctomycetota bacterium]